METPHKHYKKQNLKKHWINIQSKLYYFYIHSYLNYANMVWGSTHKIKLHEIHLKQKHAIRLVCNEKNLSTLSHSYDPYRY